MVHKTLVISSTTVHNTMVQVEVSLSGELDGVMNEQVAREEASHNSVCLLRDELNTDRPWRTIEHKISSSWIMVKEKQDQEVEVVVKDEVDSEKSACDKTLPISRSRCELNKPEPCDAGTFNYYGGVPVMAATGRGSNQVFSPQSVYATELYQDKTSEMVQTASVRGNNSLPYSNTDLSVDLRVAHKQDARQKEVLEPGEVVVGDCNHKASTVEYLQPGGEFDNQSLTAITLEPLNPALLHGKTQQYLQEHYHGLPPRHCHYHGDVGRWEQESQQRYTDISWKATEEYQNESFSQTSINEVPYLNSNNIDSENLNDCSSDLYSQAYYSDSSYTSTPAGQGRRRRKRVQTPVQRTAANLRERRRMCHLNVAFDRLKEHLPNVKDKKKLSRIQTLKAAIYYIHLLKDSLN
ncbi:hypothetical protein Btru_068550 [Bulinus truncatus]|nr:hypothetical protein Btru_068550 [Bulinus truncatus]